MNILDGVTSFASTRREYLQEYVSAQAALTIAALRLFLASFIALAHEYFPLRGDQTHAFVHPLLLAEMMPIHRIIKFPATGQSSRSVPFGHGGWTPCFRFLLRLGATAVFNR
jgi:hypothetical protein